MELRLFVAYALIALLMLAGACLVAWLRYNTRHRKLSRQRRREHQAFERRKAKLGESGPQ